MRELFEMGQVTLAMIEKGKPSGRKMPSKGEHVTSQGVKG